MASLLTPVSPLALVPSRFDLYSCRRVVGWALRKSLDRELAVSALERPQPFTFVALAAHSFLTLSAFSVALMLARSRSVAR